MTSIFDQGLEPRDANYAVQSPIDFIERTASVYPDYPAIIHGAIRRTWAETYDRCLRLASALKGRGIGRGDTVAVMLPNIPAMVECHFGIPMIGAVLNTLNVRLDAEAIAFMLEHGEAKVVIADREFGQVIKDAVRHLEHKPLVIDVDDPEYGEGVQVSDLDYEAFLQEGDPQFQWSFPDNEWDAISLNYTSGTTGNPKGVVYHHRGAYINALGNQTVWSMDMHPVYLWTLPMFHCDGWTFTWAVTAAMGTHVCLRAVEPEAVFASIAANGVTHMCGAPIVMNMLANAPRKMKTPFSQTVEIATGGAAPPSAVIEAMEADGFHVTHLYGLTETYGPATVCIPQEDWPALALQERSSRMARQGVHYGTLENASVKNPETMEDVPWDGETFGEVMIRGNTVMKGYLKNEDATQAAFAGGWFHSGDIAVRHPDGYIEIKDRSKDIIISGGENISSLEIEETLYRHPKVLEAAVVARPDETWGESPCAFVTLHEGEDAQPQEIIDFCRDNMAHYKAPRTIVFGGLPKTSTGKIQKFVLREKAGNL